MKEPQAWSVTQEQREEGRKCRARERERMGAEREREREREREKLDVLCPVNQYGYVRAMRQRDRQMDKCRDGEIE